MNDGFHGSSTFIFPIISLVFSIFISFTFLEIKQTNVWTIQNSFCYKHKQDYAHMKWKLNLPSK